MANRAGPLIEQAFKLAAPVTGQLSLMINCKKAKRADLVSNSVRLEAAAKKLREAAEIA